MTMNRRLALAATCAFAITATVAFAQQPPQAPQAPPAPQTPRPAAAVPPPPPPAPAPVAQPAGQAVNVKVDFTITDQRGSELPTKRAVSVIASDRNLGRVRSSATVFGQQFAVPLDV